VYFDIAVVAFVIDKFFGEFKFIRHPVVLMGDFISWFEKKFYKKSVCRGMLLTLSLILIVYLVIYLVTFIDNFFILGVIASTGIASNMLYKSVKDILINPQNIKFLVSRDTKNLTQSDINKAAIETYAENLSDGVIAPLFYLVIFGLEGLFIYKAINTLDSMVGYKNEKYEKFGKFSAKLDDVANFIPSRLSACLIMLLFFTCKGFYKYAKLHDSPNAGYPISAMAMVLHVKLGGDTSYFGKIKKKSYFGGGREIIEKSDLKRALSLHVKLEIFIILFLLIGWIL
jgi:adenosylcobinamide-phosphate synthase